MPRRRTMLSRAPDQRTMAEALSHPGIDPRVWFSYGLVAQDEPYKFDPEYGPLIAVELQPSGVTVNARVGMQVAGDGEGDYHPFVEGDEVAVLLEQGHERGNCLIVARCSNKRAPFPTGSVGGQDPTTNSFGFTRRRTPYIQENAGPVLLRQATSEAFLSLDEKGVITLRDGQKAALQMSPDTFGYQSGDAKFLMQLDLSGGRYTLQVKDALLTLSASSASPNTSGLVAPGTFSASTLANPPIEHVLTTEAAVSIVQNIFNVLGLALVALGPVPLLANALGALLVDPAFATTTIAPALLAASSGTLPGYSAVIAPEIQTLFGTAGQKPPGIPGLGQVKPGVGCQGLLAG